MWLWWPERGPVAPSSIGMDLLNIIYYILIAFSPFKGMSVSSALRSCLLCLKTGSRMNWSKVRSERVCLVTGIGSIAVWAYWMLIGRHANSVISTHMSLRLIGLFSTPGSFFMTPFPQLSFSFYSIQALPSVGRWHLLFSSQLDSPLWWSTLPLPPSSIVWDALCGYIIAAWHYTMT